MGSQPRGSGGRGLAKGETGSETEEVAMVGGSGVRGRDTALGVEGMQPAQSGPRGPKDRRAREGEVQPAQDGNF